MQPILTGWDPWSPEQTKSEDGKDALSTDFVHLSTTGVGMLGLVILEVFSLGGRTICRNVEETTFVSTAFSDGHVESWQ